MSLGRHAVKQQACDFRREAGCRYALDVHLVFSTLVATDCLSAAPDMVSRVARCNPPVTEGP